MYGYEDNGSERGPVNRYAIGAAAIVAAAALGWFVVRPALDEEPETVVPIDQSTLGASPTTVPLFASLPTTTTAGAAPDTTGTSPTPESTAATTTTASAAATTTTAAARTATTAARTTTTTAPPTTTTTRPSQAEPEPYPTLPDGNPQPLIAIFDRETIRLTGNVPTEADKRQMAVLADANSKFHPIEIVNDLTINPAVPRNIGTRVIELTSTRFPESSAEVLPAHAAELDRVATVMNALPRVTVLVIGHADQRGDPVENYALSEQRAQAVVTYLVGKGITPSRLSSRAVGEDDLLSLDDDDAALALNRRTEFVFYGLLLE